MKVFIAGPLFSRAEREFNFKLDAHLREHGFETFLPQREVGELRKPRKPEAIFKADLFGLEQADGIVAILDGPDVDSGTAFEIGYAHAKGKPVIGLKTDSRWFARGEEINLMLGQSLYALVENFDELLSELARLQRSKK